MPIDTFTSWHAAGFGFLYQLTGEQKYADLSKQCVELMLAGKFDRNPRYSWISGGTTMRASNVLGAMAYAYDFCYNAWPEDFARKSPLKCRIMISQPQQILPAGTRKKPRPKKMVKNSMKNQGQPIFITWSAGQISARLEPLRRDHRWCQCCPHCDSWRPWR